MALVDFIPVILFTITSVILQRDLYNKMSKGAFALFATGTIDIVFAGFCKALYKLLYATGLCDLQVFNTLFFPVQSVGFLFAGLGLIAMMMYPQHSETALAAAAPPVFSGTPIFVSFMVIGFGCICSVMSVISVKLKKPALIILFAIVFLLYLSMGYLSSRDFTNSAMNWLAQGLNVLGQGLMLTGVIALHRAGLTDLILKKH